MSEDTIIVDRQGEEAPKAKRAKRDDPTNGALTAFRFKPYRGPQISSKAPPNGDADTPRGIENVLHGVQESGYKGSTVLNEPISRFTAVNKGSMESGSTGISGAGRQYTTPAATGKSSTRTRRQPSRFLFKAYDPERRPRSRRSNANTGSQSHDNEYLPDSLVFRTQQPEDYFSDSSDQAEEGYTQTPDDPIELAWWLAHQISHFENLDPVLPKPNPAEALPIIQGQGSNAPRHPDRNYIREQARLRQQKWRAMNRERKNLNDLRSRVNREAKQKFGTKSSAGKTAWIEKELVKRRNKLETKQRLQLAVAGKWPQFKVTKEVRESMLARDQSLPAKEQKIRSLVIDLLFPTEGKKTNKSAPIRKAEALFAAVGEGSVGNDDILGNVLKVIADTPEAMKSIRAGVAGVATEVAELEENLAPDRDDLSPLQHRASKEPIRSNAPKESGKAPAAAPQDASEDSEAEPVKMMNAINDAVAILARIKDVTNRIPAASSTKQQKKSQKQRAKPTSIGIDLDAFLITANAGPLDSPLENPNDPGIEHSSDETISDPGELVHKGTPVDADKKSDSEIWSTINHVIDELVSMRQEYEAKKQDSNGFNVQAQAQKARKLLEDADLRTNFAMTKAKSKAISHLYSQLPGLLDSDSQLTKDPPTTMDLRRNSEPQPEASKDLTVTPRRPTIPAQPSVDPPRSLLSLADILNSPEPSGVRTEEEQRKIKSYGFPPLPGFRIGTPRS